MKKLFTEKDFYADGSDWPKPFVVTIANTKTAGLMEQVEKLKAALQDMIDMSNDYIVGCESVIADIETAKAISALSDFNNYLEGV